MAFDSLYTGISGLDAYQSWIDTISNNIANTATTGFKAQRVTFADQFYQQVGAPSGPTQTNGGINPIDQGLGVKVNTVDTEFAQGGLQTTGINTDLALNGDGFFILANANGTGSPTYTRDGAFSLNSNGLFYDPGSGLAVLGYTANADGAINNTGTPGAITIPLGLQEKAQATGTGTKVGPNLNDQVFDVSLGGNLNQTAWSEAFQKAVGASANGGTPATVSTTFYDSLGNSHEATITYTPVAPSAQPASTSTAGTTTLTTGISVAPSTSTTDTIKVTANGAGGFTILDTNTGSIQTALQGQTLTIGAVTLTLATGAATTNETITVNPAKNGLPKTVENSQGVAVTPATEWAVNVSFADGTQIQTITQAATISPGGVLSPAKFGTGSSGTIGYAYFDQNGQFINSSAIDAATDNAGIGANAAGYLHIEGQTASVNQGNQLNVLQWGPSVGNNAQAPTNLAQPGSIALGYYDTGSLAGSSTPTVVSQNGYSAGILSNITVGQDGTITGSFTNGQTKALAQLAIATFQNEGGLQRDGGNQFSATAASGLAQVGTASTGRYGSVVAGALEQSNVNLANEFTNLIVAQRAFEANSRGIQTADQNLITVTHIQASEN